MHADPALEATLPDEVRGVRLAKSSIRAVDLTGTGAETALGELAGRLGRPLDDLTLAAAVDPTGQLAGGVNAMRVRNGSGDALLDAIVELEQRDTAAVVTQVVLGGRSVTRLQQQAGEVTVTRFLRASGDTVYVVLAPDETTAALFLERLP